MVDFASCQARVLGLSDEYQALGRWYFASGGADFPAYLSAHFPRLYSDFRLDFSSGSSCFLSAPPPVSGPSASLPSSSSFLSHSSAVSCSTGHFSSTHYPSSAFPFSVRPGAPVSSSPPLAPLASPLSHPPGFLPSLSSSFPVRPSSLPGPSVGVPVSSGVGVLARLVVPAASPVSSLLFRRFASDPSAPLSGSFTPPPSLSLAASAFSSSSWFSSAPPSVDRSAAFGFGA